LAPRFDYSDAVLCPVLGDKRTYLAQLKTTCTTHRVTSAPSNAAVRKNGSIKSSTRPSRKVKGRVPGRARFAAAQAVLKSPPLENHSSTPCFADERAFASSLDIHYRPNHGASLCALFSPKRLGDFGVQVGRKSKVTAFMVGI
jgi:hypothetical protein